ncbi:acyltransferase family protein [Bradyrhizobium australiense]|uniref:Acyltransferase n=1 Tax=Bradyrhizobium australiense TaxID=2721161 RepID=A0A7Y4GY24_9BRAD|nr:acyltransferase [Bradyrhizobium australiense]NOJ43762.1 acyltransferase [Bradyrhizobium australiense]
MEQDKLPGLQIARAVAALSVVYYHSWVGIVRFPPNTAYPISILRDYGFLGVDLFFAISGFVICLVVTRPAFNVTRFLTNRIFRLYPLWLATLTAFALSAMLWRGLVREHETLGYFLWSAALLPTKEFPFYDVGWTLQHEIAFYVIAAVIVPRLGAAGLVAFLAASALAGHAFNLPWYLGNFARYHPEFLAGALAFLARPYLARIGAAVPLAIGAGLAWFLMADPGERPFAPIALFFLIVGFANIRDTKSRLMAAGCSVGDASYSIYLIHPLVFLIASAIVSKLTLPIWSQEPVRLACFAIICAVSLLSWKLYEKPMIRLGNRICPGRGLSIASLTPPAAR